MASAGALSVDVSAPDHRPVRDLGLDRFRGALVILMVGGNYLAGVEIVPVFLKHAPDVGLTIADVVAPAFVFAIGLTYRSSFERRAREGLGPAYRHFLLRYLSLLGIGAIISAGSTSVADRPSDWGVLQALGVAGLLTLVVIRLGTVSRLVAGLALLGGYQILLDRWAMSSVMGSSHGGFIGSLSWSALLILATVVADSWRSGVRRYVLCVVGLGLVAAGSVWLVPVSKNRVSLSFVLVTLAMSAVAWLLVSLGARGVPARAGVLCWWGENPLALYLAQLPLLGLVTLPGKAWLYSEVTLPFALGELALLLAVTSSTAWWLHRRGLRLTL